MYLASSGWTSRLSGAGIPLRKINCSLCLEVSSSSASIPEETGVRVSSGIGMLCSSMKMFVDLVEYIGIERGFGLGHLSVDATSATSQSRLLPRVVVQELVFEESWLPSGIALSSQSTKNAGVFISHDRSTVVVVPSSVSKSKSCGPNPAGHQDRAESPYWPCSTVYCPQLSETSPGTAGTNVLLFIV